MFSRHGVAFVCGGVCASLAACEAYEQRSSTNGSTDAGDAAADARCDAECQQEYPEWPSASSYGEGEWQAVFWAQHKKYTYQ